MREAGPAIDGDVAGMLQIVDYLQSGHERVDGQMIPIDGTRLAVRQTIAELNTMSVNFEFAERNCHCMRSDETLEEGAESWLTVRNIVAAEDGMWKCYTPEAS